MDVITTHTNADFDCLGSMIAVRRLYPEAIPVFPGGVAPNVRTFLEQCAGCVAGFKKPREIDRFTVKRLILVDVRQAERIGPLAGLVSRPGVELHIFDHHPESDGDLQGDFTRVEQVGATVTVLVEVMKERGIVPTADEATVMMLGLYEDTGSLQFTSTTVRDYAAAAFLLNAGANLNRVAEALMQEMTGEQVTLLHQLLDSRNTLNVNGIDITLAHATAAGFVGDIASLAHRIKDMERLDALILIVRMKDRIFLVGRSRRPEVPMGEILAEFGGGGHPQAASAIVREETLVQVLESLPRILMLHVKPHWEVRHLMTAPVKTIPLDLSMDQARAFLTRYNINAAPVMDGDMVVGILTRQLADKAAYHGLANVAVSEYMQRDFTSVSPSTSIDTLTNVIVNLNQRFVPVMEQGVLVGAMTRTDLLRHMVSRRRVLPLPSSVHGGQGGKGGKQQQIERLLNDLLPLEIRSLLEKIGQLAADLGVEAYAVGGFVRDLLLRTSNFDIDIVVEGDGIAFAEEFARRHGGRARAHEKFSTAVLILPDGFKIDVASTRMEYYLEPGALPTVEHASLKLDLYRRDFTINTLALALNRQHFGELFDFYGAREDLNSRVLRVLHNLSFVEDPTRAFRAIRFEQRLGFKIGAHTESLLRSAVRMGFIDKVGGPRLFNELVAILREETPFSAIRRLDDFDLLRYLHPALQASDGVGKLFESASRALHWHELLYTGEKVESWKLYLLCLTAHLDDEALAATVSHLQLPHRMALELTAGRTEAHRLLGSLQRRRRRSTEPRPSELHQWFGRLSTVLLLYLTARADHEEIRRWLSRYLVHLRHVEPQLNGDDLRRLGYPPGPLFRQILNELLDARLDGKVESQQDEVTFVKKRFPQRTKDKIGG